MDYLVKKESLCGLLDECVFGDAADVYEKHSQIECNLKQFASSEEVFSALSTEGRLDLAIHYRIANGFVHFQRIDVESREAVGTKYRVMGWGLVFLFLQRGDEGLVKCSVSANTEKRAISWANTYRDLRDPHLWDWSVVVRKRSRLERALKDAQIR